MNKISNINEEKVKKKRNDFKIKEDNKYKELLNLLNEEKNKNKKLLEELYIEKIKVKELNYIIKLNEKSNNENIKKDKETEKLMKTKNSEINKLKDNNNDKKTNIEKEEEIIVIFFIFMHQDIHRRISCKNTDTFAKIEEKICNEFPKYKDYNTYLTVNGNIIKRFKTLEENGIEDGNTIIANIFDKSKI